MLRDSGARRVSPLTVPLMMANAGSAALAMRHGLQGPVYGVVSACAAGAHAIGAGMRMIQAGDADAAIVGGSEAALTALASAAFAAMDATSTSGISRPFDARRDGFVMGEGAGVLVLEARRRRGGARRARSIGELLGYAATADAHHLTAPEPDGRGAARAIERALADAELRPERPRLRERARHLHAAERPRRDGGAQVRAGRARTAACPVSSTKSAIGHLLGAAGAVEAVATVLALSERVAPPDARLRRGRRGPRPRLRARRAAAAAAVTAIAPRDRRSRTRSASAGTTPCSASRGRRERRPRPAPGRRSS